MKWTAFQNLTFRFFLIIFLKFRNFQPRYSFKIYSYKKESISVEFLVIFPVKTGPENVAMYYKIKQYALKGFFLHFSVVRDWPKSIGGGGWAGGERGWVVRF